MKIFAVSGVKNAGKTTLITALLHEFLKRDLQVAVIKHDGHDFQADVPGTDSFRYMEAGAMGSIVFSSSKLLLVKRKAVLSTERIAACFPEAELVLLEGFKHSPWPKLEVIRAGVSDQSICREHNLTAIVTDLEPHELANKDPCTPVFTFNDLSAIAGWILKMAMVIEPDYHK